MNTTAAIERRPADLARAGFSALRLGRMHQVLGGHVERGELPGLVALVARHGEVHVEAFGTMTTQGGGAMDRDTIFRIASMTKPVSAAAAMILVEECRVRLDDPVDRFLPELANRGVLKRIGGPLDDTVPANRPVTLRDLLTLRMGIGHLMLPTNTYPIQQALKERGLLQGPPHPRTMPTPDEWMHGVGTLPLMYQPGERWMYDLGLDVLGVLIARASGQPLETFMRERLFEPLGMKDTGFHVPPEKHGRLPGCYYADPATGALAPYDEPGAMSEWSSPPPFPSAAGGLVSTADDYLAFCAMMINKGRHGSQRILSRPSVDVMTSDQLTPEQRTSAPIFFGDDNTWGFGMSVATRRSDLANVPGRFGWTGGLGTSAYTDPAEGVVGILLTQCLMSSPQAPEVFRDFWTCAYQAIDD
ncbi:MAG: beta-lactamase family protein [Bacteroidetes bacterium]|nr:beta-lactamase family protein [Bacteroidota bacterium]